MVNPTVLATTLQSLRPKRVRFVTTAHSPVCGSNSHSIQLHYLWHCSELLGSKYDYIIKTRPDHVWMHPPQFEYLDSNSVISRNDWAMIVPRKAFVALRHPSTCDKMCRHPVAFLESVMPANNEYCALMAHFSRFGVSHAECSHPGERELFMRRALPEQCVDLIGGRITRWHKHNEQHLIHMAGFQDQSFVCKPFEPMCTKTNATPFIDIDFDAPIPLLDIVESEPYGFV